MTDLKQKIKELRELSENRRLSHGHVLSLLGVLERYELALERISQGVPNKEKLTRSEANIDWGFRTEADQARAEALKKLLGE